MKDAQTVSVEVIGIEQVTPLIKHFTLAPVDGGSLPAFSGGSHIIVVMQGAERVHRNPYSLLSAPQQLDTYEIGVRRMEESRGGSHSLCFLEQPCVLNGHFITSKGHHACA